MLSDVTRGNENVTTGNENMGFIDEGVVLLCVGGIGIVGNVISFSITIELVWYCGYYLEHISSTK